MKVAVIGSGISGNVAAYHLNKHHKITVYEANDYIGGHTHTHDINHQGKHFSVDTGFIVFNHKTYPNFIALLKELGVEEQLSTMSFGVKCEKTGLEYMGSTINSLFAQRRNIFRPGCNARMAAMRRAIFRGVALAQRCWQPTGLAMRRGVGCARHCRRAGSVMMTCWQPASSGAATATASCLIIFVTG